MAGVELNVCKFNNVGHCKFGSNCRNRHTLETCTNFPCRVKECPLRHPKMCKYFVQFGQCRFKENCSYLHFSELDKTKKGLEKEIETLKIEVEALKSRNIEIETIMRRLAIIETKLEPKEGPAKVIEIEPEAFKCEDCGYIASSRSVLKRHKTIKHDKNNQGPDISFNFNQDRNKASDDQNGKDSTENEDCESMEEETEEIEENQCHLCMQKLENHEKLWKHFEAKHEHFYSLTQKNVPLT